MELTRSRPYRRCSSVAAYVVLVVVGVGCTHRVRLKSLTGTGNIAQNGALHFDLSKNAECVRQQYDGARYVWLRDVECPDEVAKLLKKETTGAPELVVKTPWGAVWRAPITKKGRAKFAIDWGRAGFDPLVEADTARLSGPWSVSVQGTSLAMKWSPGPRDIANALSAVEQAVRTMARTGAAPPALRIKTFATKNNTLRAGARTRLQLTLVNSGTGPAYGVVAVTQSELPALHNLRFAFGRIAAGKSATKVLDVAVPRDTADFSAVVSLGFTEANQHAPKGHSQRFKVVVNQCPEGTLTNRVYTAKRAKLERALGAKALSRAEFDKYDTALLLCLE